MIGTVLLWSQATGLPFTGLTDWLIYFLATVLSVVGTRLILARAVRIPKIPKSRSGVSLLDGPAYKVRLRAVEYVLYTPTYVGGVAAFFLGMISPLVFWLLVFSLPALFGWISWTMSSEVRHWREEERLEKEAERLAVEAGNKKAQEAAIHQETIQARDWTRRVMEACFWWTSEGRQLYTSDRFRDEYVRAKLEITKHRSQILQTYHDPEHPCATGARRTAIAEWVMAHRSDVVVEHLVKEPDPPTARRIANILRLHHGCDADILREATALLLLKTVQASRPAKEEPLSEQWKRLNDEEEAFVALKERATNEIVATAGARWPENPERREEYILEQTEKLGEWIRFKLIERAQLAGGEENAPAYSSRGA